MQHVSRHLLALQAGLLAVAAYAQGAAEPIPVETFFREHDVSRVRISPDGEYIAFIGQHRSDHRLFTMNLKSGKMRGAGGDRGLDIYGYYWADNENLIFSVSQDNKRALGLFVSQDNKSALGLFSIRRDRKGMNLIVKDRRVDIIGGLNDGKPGVLALVSTVAIRKPSVYLVDYLGLGRIDLIEAFTDQARVIVKNPGNIDRWMCDRRGNVRLGWEIHFHEERDPTFSYISRGAEETEWRSLELPEDVEPYAFDWDEHALYVTAEGETSTDVLVRYDLESGSMGEPILKDPQFDVTSGYPVFSRKRERLVGVTYDRVKTTSVWFDPFYRELQAKIDSMIPGLVNKIVDFSDDETRFVVFSQSDREPGAYYLFDFREDQVSPLFRTRPWIEPAQMARMMGVTFEARDGMTIHGYFTRPMLPAKPPYPLVVLPHGGPFYRDVWGFDSEAQFLANRGYAVLQINYRGSTGYGADYKDAAKGQFGKKIQDDITDAARGAIAMNIADPSRVAIFGTSFGGYAALCGLTSEPDLYKCGIAMAGVYDWNEHLKKTLRDKKYGIDYSYEVFSYWLKDTDNETADIYNASPINFVERIQAPVLVIHGGSDSVVEARQSKLLVAALKREGKQHESFINPWEAHGFRGEKARIKLYRKIEEFLAKHL